MSDTTDHAELRKLAEKAHWPLYYETCAHPMRGFFGAASLCARSKGHHGDCYQVYGSLDSERYLAACDPQTVLGLLDALAAAEKVIKAVRRCDDNCAHYKSQELGRCRVHAALAAYDALQATPE